MEEAVEVEEEEADVPPLEDMDIRDFNQTELLSRAAMVDDATSLVDDEPALLLLALEEVLMNFWIATCAMRLLSKT